MLFNNECIKSSFGSTPILVSIPLSFLINFNSPIKEEIHLSCLSAHKDVNFTEVKSVLPSLLKTGFNLSYNTVPQKESMFVDGRIGSIVVRGKKLGSLGEIDAKISDNLSFNMSFASVSSYFFPPYVNF